MATQQPTYECSVCGPETRTETMNEIMNHCNECEGNPEPVSDTRDAGELPELAVAWEGDGNYIVWSDTDTQSAYRVHLGRRECTCQHGVHQQSDSNGACRHIGKVVSELPASPSGHDVARESMFDASAELRSAVETLRDLTRAADDTLQRENTRDVTQGTSNDTGNSANPEKAAQRLQEAFDDIVTGMEAEASGGKVWINKTPDAPEYTFNAFLKGPGMMQFTDDDPDAPSQYHKNYLDPRDVDEYINEVLS